MKASRAKRGRLSFIGHCSTRFLQPLLEWSRNLNSHVNHVLFSREMCRVTIQPTDAKGTTVKRTVLG